MRRFEPLAVDPDALEEADRQLSFLEDSCLEAGEDVPPWVVAARYAVDQARQEVDDG